MCTLCGSPTHNVTTHRKLFRDLLARGGKGRRDMWKANPDGSTTRKISKEARNWRKKGALKRAKSEWVWRKKPEDKGNYVSSGGNTIEKDPAAGNRRQATGGLPIVTILRSTPKELAQLLGLRVQCSRPNCRGEVNATLTCTARECRRVWCPGLLRNTQFSFPEKVLVLKFWLEGIDVTTACSNMTQGRTTISDAFTEIRRTIGEFQKNRQEEIRFPDYAVLEADESAMKQWKVTSKAKNVTWCSDVWIGVVGRGSRQTLLHHVGVRRTRTYKRFPNIKSYVWARFWNSSVRKKTRDSRTLTICTDGKQMYNPEKKGFGYKHYNVIHQKKQYWKKHKITGLQVGTQVIYSR